MDDINFRQQTLWLRRVKGQGVRVGYCMVSAIFIRENKSVFFPVIFGRTPFLLSMCSDGFCEIQLIKDKLLFSVSIVVTENICYLKYMKQCFYSRSVLVSMEGTKCYLQLMQRSEIRYYVTSR